MSELMLFVREALTRGASRDEIGQVLREAGWRPDEINDALARYADVSFPVPVPRPKPSPSARDAFLYLVLFLTLYISAFNIGALLFQFVDLWVPDPLQDRESYGDPAESIRFAVASVVISFPIFLLLSRMLQRAYRADPERRGSPVRLWLTYITLFFAAATIIGDLIALVSGLLSGGLTPRFLLKVLSVAAVAGTIFGYYLWELRHDDRKKEA